MCYVTEQLMAASGRPGSEWVERAKANLLARTPADSFQVIHENRVCGCAAWPTPTIRREALLLDALLPEVRSEGNLLIVPGRDELVVLPVTLASIPHMHMLKALAEQNFKSAPYPISDEVYWVHEGAWHRFPIDIRSQEVNVEPPAAFVEAISRLTPPQP